MSSFRSRARKFAFGNSTDNLSETSSTRSSIRSSDSQSPNRGMIRHSSSISEQCTCHSDGMSKASHVAPRRTNRVRRIHRSQPFEHFVEALEADGCVIVEDFVNPQISERIQEADQANLENVDLERRTRSINVDVNSLIRESLVSDSLFQTLSTHFLTLETISWKDQQIGMNTTKPTISSSTTRDLNASMFDPPSFQRADAIYHKRHSATQRYEYQSRRDASIGVFVPELDSLSASVDMAIIPGSHLWDDQKPDIARGAKELQLCGGDALILLGSLYHRVGSDDFDVETPRPNISRASSRSSCTLREKLMHEIWMCSGVYRPVKDIESKDSEE